MTILNNLFEQFRKIICKFCMTLLYEFSIDLPNITLFLNFEFYFLTFLPDFSACFQNYVLRSI